MEKGRSASFKAHLRTVQQLFEFSTFYAKNRTTCNMVNLDLVGRVYLCAAVLASSIPALCIHERTGVMPLVRGSSFMVKAPRGRPSWMENMKIALWGMSLYTSSNGIILLHSQNKATWITKNQLKGKKSSPKRNKWGKR